MVRQRIFSAALGALTFGLGLASCQEVEQPSPVLTEKQWEQVNKHIYDYAHDEDPPEKSKNPDQAPEPEYKIGANFQNKIDFIGFSVGDPDKNEPVPAGETTTFRWYWRAREDIDKNWKIFVHFDSKDTGVDPAKRRQNLDHDPLDGRFPTSKWPKGKIIEDVQEVQIRGDYPPGPAVPYVGFFRGKTRLSIENDVPQTDDNRVKAPSLEVSNTGGPEQGSRGDRDGEKPTYNVTSAGDAASDVTVDGELSESVWSDAPPLSLSPFGSGPDKETTIRAVRGEQHLFIGARLEDAHVWSEKEQRDSKTWSEEVVEMFIDVDGDGSNYLELQVNALGTIFDANFKDRLGTGDGSRSEQINRAKKFDIEGLESAVSVDGTVNDDSDEDSHWSVELKIPLTSIPGVDSADEVGEPWAVNFYRFDRPGGKDGNRTLSFAWNTAARGDFHQVDKFGTFTFGDGDGSNSGNEIPENVKNPPVKLPTGKGTLDPDNLKGIRQNQGSGSN